MIILCTRGDGFSRPCLWNRPSKNWYDTSTLDPRLKRLGWPPSGLDDLVFGIVCLPRRVGADDGNSWFFAIRSRRFPLDVRDALKHLYVVAKRFVVTRVGLTWGGPRADCYSAKAGRMSGSRLNLSTQRAHEKGSRRAWADILYADARSCLAEVFHEKSLLLKRTGF
jgi:hypothetical protein